MIRPLVELKDVASLVGSEDDVVAEALEAIGGLSKR